MLKSAYYRDSYSDKVKTTKPAPMIITFILASDGSSIGGMETQLALQANQLGLLADYQVNIIANQAYRHLFSESLNFIALKTGRSRKNPLLLAALYRHIKALQSQIIHAHGHKAAQLISTLKPFLTNKAQLIATVHGKKKSNQCLKNMDLVIAVSPSIQKHLLPTKSHCLVNCVDAKPSKRALLSKTSFCQTQHLSPLQPLVIAVGRLAKVKRYDLLIQAVRGLNINLVIVGDGPERGNLENLRSDNVTFVGHRSDAREIMACADLLVISSEREGFSITLIESLMEKLVVLSTPVPGSVDILPSQCLFESHSADAMRALIQAFLDAPETFNALLEPIFIEARKTFSVDNNIRQLTHLYQTLSAQ